MSSQVFPSDLPGLKLRPERTPLWKTRPQEAASGKETRIALAAYPQYRFELAWDILRDDLAVSDLKKLVGFFNHHNGGFDTFLYSDPAFNAVTDEQFGTGDGTSTVFQVTATYKDPTGIGFAEAIQNFNGTPTIKKAGVTQTLTTHYTISGTGVVTFVTAPTAGQALTWTGGFYYRCKFLEDNLAGLREIATRWWELQRLRFKSIKL